MQVSCDVARLTLGQPWGTDADSLNANARAIDIYTLRTIDIYTLRTGRPSAKQTTNIMGQLIYSLSLNQTVVQLLNNKNCYHQCLRAAPMVSIPASESGWVMLQVLSGTRPIPADQGVRLAAHFYRPCASESYHWV